MAEFYEKEILTATGKRDESGEPIKAPKLVLFFKHGSGFEGRADDAVIKENPGAYQEFLDSKDPAKLEAKHKEHVKQLKKELEEKKAALKGGKK